MGRVGAAGAGATWTAGSDVRELRQSGFTTTCMAVPRTFSHASDGRATRIKLNADIITVRLAHLQAPRFSAAPQVQPVGCTAQPFPRSSTDTCKPSRHCSKRHQVQLVIVRVHFTTLWYQRAIADVPRRAFARFLAAETAPD